MPLTKIAKLALTDFSALPPDIRQTIQLWAITLLFTTHVLWACGWIPGMPGFALTSDVTGIQREIHSLTMELRQQRLDYLEERILSAYAEHCRVSDVELRQIHQQRLQRLLRLYQDMTGNLYPLQPCEP